MLPRSRAWLPLARQRGEVDLIFEARSGDRASAEELCRRHLPAVWRAAYAVCGRRALADEAVQDCFERVLRNLDRFDLERPFTPWVHRIAINCAVDQVRRQRIHEELDESKEPTDHGGVPVEEREELIGALSGLSLDHRTVVVLRVLLDHTAADVAETLGVPVGTVHSRLSRALGELRSSLIGAADDR